MCTREERLGLLKEIEKSRNAKLIIYITGDRKNLETKIGNDIINIFQRLLIKSTIKNNKIDLLVYSMGGDGVAALGLVSLIREYCNEFNVIIPYKAYSAATLIALGANNIIMLKSGQLSPVDVNVTTPFNPSIPGPQNKPQFLPINVEDLSGYFELAKEITGIKNEKYLVQVLQFLTNKVHPLSIGAVHRAREKNLKIAKSLLDYHMTDNKKKQKISDIITRGLYQHSFLISKKDAIELGLPVRNISNDFEKEIWSLFEKYSKLLKLNNPINHEILLGEENKKRHTFNRAIIEYLNDNEELETYTFSTKVDLIRESVRHPKIGIPLPEIIVKPIEDSWIINTEI